ncbi:M48 family metallopeptidase [Peribacillus sp. SCS-37]|uniref:M48 family metallopeptidase n=1 Tax=Paraperibacillus esterisolvens TaxID=3115296 RepID=UPI0039066CDF
MIHTYNGEAVHYEVQFKNRKSFGITVDGYGIVTILAPKGTPEQDIKGLLEANWAPIQEKLKEMKDRLSGPQEKSYDPGEGFLYLGKSFPIEVFHDAGVEQDHVVFNGSILYIYVKHREEERIRQALKRFYYQQCKTLVEAGIQSYQVYFKLKPRSIRITDSKTTWGTCDSKQKLTFNWKLAMAPRSVIDYVVVHEMCHMVHLNHDRSFWRLVGRIMPDYEEMEDWLAASSWRMTV